MGAGGLVLVGGLGLGLVSLQTTKEFNATTDPILQANLEVRGGREALTANILMGVGGATVATGLLVWLLSDDDVSEAQVQERFSPLVSASPGGFVLGVGGHW